MKEDEVKNFIVSTIEREVATAKTQTCHRPPLVSFAEVNNEDFQQIKKIVGEHHLMPDDLLPEAETMVAFFLPFSEHVVRANNQNPYVAREWAVAYIGTNRLISHICEVLVEGLGKRDIKAASDPPTLNFDREKLVARWSHRSVAVMAGLGNFGLNRMLITDSGCTGRCGSLLLKTKLTPVVREPRQRCLYFYDGSCHECIQHCPVGALTENGMFDRHACYRHLLKADAFFNDLPTTLVCGKCAVGLPCSVRSAVES